MEPKNDKNILPEQNSIDTYSDPQNVSVSETKKDLAQDGIEIVSPRESNKFKAPTPQNPNLVEIPNLRTYKQDVKEVVQNQDITSTRILLDEQRKKANEALAEESISIKSAKNKWLVVFGLLLIALAGSIFGYKYLMKPAVEGPEFILERPDFISVEEQVEVATELRNKRDIYNDIEKIIIEPIQENTIREIVLTKTKTNIVGDQPVQQKELIGTSEFFTLLEGRAPDSLVRSLGSEFMLGIFGINVGEAFVLFKVNDFENAFASLLNWESTMAQDFQPIFFTNYKPEELLKSPEEVSEQNTITDNATTTASTTESINIAPKLTFDPTLFEDKVIFNTDARIIKDEFGDVLFYYTFINDEYLIFANEEKVLEETANRLRQAKLIR